MEKGIDVEAKLLMSKIDELIEKMPSILVDRLVSQKVGQQPIEPIQLDMSDYGLDLIPKLELEPLHTLPIVSTHQYNALEVVPEVSENNLEPSFEKTIQNYELQKLSEKKKKSSSLKKKRSLNTSNRVKVNPIPKISDPSSEKGDNDDGFETEPEQPEKPVRNRGKDLWMIIKKHVKAKICIKSFAAKEEDNDNREGNVKQEGENDTTIILKPNPFVKPQNPISIPNAEAEVKKVDLKMTPIYQYHLSRRALDMERFPLLYKDKKIDQETKELQILCTPRPIIGIAEGERQKLPRDDIDTERALTISIRNGVLLNGYIQGSNQSLYETVHGIQRRKLGLTPFDRAKFPTFDDPGPAADAPGVVQKEGTSSPVPGIDLNEELQKIETILLEPQGGTAANFRKRGIILARMEKYARAMEDLDRAIQIEPSSLEGLWHHHQQFLRINDAESALADLDSITEQNKSHYAAFQAKARIYQAIGFLSIDTND